MSEGLQFDIRADVSDAAKNIKALASDLDKVDSSVKKTAKSVGDSAKSFDVLSKTSEKSAISVNSTESAFEALAKTIDASVSTKVDNLIKSFHAVEVFAPNVTKTIDVLGISLKKFVPPDLTGKLNILGHATQTAAAVMPKLGAATGQVNQSLINFGRVIQDAPFGMMGIANNIDPLLSSFQRLKAETGSTKAAFSALLAGLTGPAGIAIGVSTVTSLLVAFGPQIKSFIFGTKAAGQAAAEAAKDTDSYVKKLSEQKFKVEELVHLAKDESQSNEIRARALQKLNDIIPDTIGHLTKQNIATAEGVNIIGQYVKAIEAQATAELLIGRVAENNVKLFDNQSNTSKELLRNYKEIQSIRLRIEQLNQAGNFTAAAAARQHIIDLENERSAILDKSRETAEEINRDNLVLKRQYEAILPTAITLDKLSTDKVKKIREEKDINDQINRIGLEMETRSQREIRLLEEKIAKQEQLNALGKEVMSNAPKRMPGIGGELGDRRSDNEKNTGTTAFSAMNEQAKLLSDTINNGINAGIDQFFNAIANNQDPFAAMIQGVKRLIVELAAAVVKMLVLKAIGNAIAPGVGGAAASGIGSALGFATGGFVSQPTLATIAENGPEFVLRPDQLGAIMNMGGGGGAFQQVGVRIQGEELFVLLQRTQSRRARNN